MTLTKKIILYIIKKTFLTSHEVSNNRKMMHMNLAENYITTYFFPRILYLYVQNIFIVFFSPYRLICTLILHGLSSIKCSKVIMEQFLHMGKLELERHTRWWETQIRLNREASFQIASLISSVISQRRKKMKSEEICFVLN